MADRATMTSSPIQAATMSDIDAYWRDGAVLLRDVFSPSWVAELAAGIEEVCANPQPDYHWYAGGPGQARVFFNATRNWPRVARIRRFIWESGVAKLAARIARSAKVDLLWDGVFYRSEGLDRPTPWHQDAPYWPFEGDKIVSVWTPVDAAAADSALGFVRGSHRMGRFQRRSFRDGGQTTHFVGDREDAQPLPDIDGGAPGFAIMRAAMAPGDCLVFHGMTLHGAPGNKAAAHKLRAISFRFAVEGTVFVERPEGTSPAFGADVVRPGQPVAGPMFPEVWRGRAS